jgi:hypothetical protein
MSLRCVNIFDTHEKIKVIRINNEREKQGKGRRDIERNLKEKKLKMFINLKFF